MPFTILVTDDDLGTRLAISDYLEMSGYSVLTASDGQEALAVVETYHPDLMVTDIVMPRLNGYELVKRVRQHPAFRLLPVIFLTSRNETEERIQGYQAGGDIYLPKPFELAELGAAICSLLERSHRISGYYLASEDSHSLHNAENPQSPLNLSPRERDVLVLLTHGLSNAEIGTRLHLSPRTVEKYVSSLFRKTETSNRAELVGFAMKHRLVQ